MLARTPHPVKTRSFRNLLAIKHRQPTRPLLTAFSSGTVFSGGTDGRPPTSSLRTVRQIRGILHLRQILHHLQEPGKSAPRRRWVVLLSRLPRSLRRRLGQQPIAVPKNPLNLRLSLDHDERLAAA